MLTIFNLNDDCILNILKYLSLRDHLNLSKSCSRFLQMIMDQSSAIYPAFHTKKPVIYYTSAAVKLFRIVDNNVRTLGVVQGHSHDEEDLGNAVRDFRILTEARNKVDMRRCWKESPRMEDMFRFSSSRRKNSLNSSILLY